MAVDWSGKLLRANSGLLEARRFVIIILFMYFFIYLCIYYSYFFFLGGGGGWGALGFIGFIGSRGSRGFKEFTGLLQGLHLGTFIGFGVLKFGFFWDLSVVGGVGAGLGFVGA